MEYSSFQERLQQSRGQPPFQLDLNLGEPLELRSPLGDTPLSAQSSIGPSYAEPFSADDVEMATSFLSENLFTDHIVQHASPLSGFSFSSQAASPIDCEGSAAPYSTDLQSMSLDPPRRQRGHRRAQSDYSFLERNQYSQSFVEQEERVQNGEQETNGDYRSRQMDLLGHIDAEELQNLLKSKSAENLSLDPKKAKRIIANRQSAARSKEKKVRYIADLEQRLQQLHSEATSLQTLMSVLEKDTACLSSENTQLTKSLQALETQAQLRDGLNERLRREVVQLKQQAHQLQHKSHPQAEGALRNGHQFFAQEGPTDPRTGLGDFLILNGAVESPTPSSNPGQGF